MFNGTLRSQFITLAFFLVTFSLLSASRFDHTSNHYSGVKIDKLKIVGERCSGTNFIESLLHKNFPGAKKSHLLEFGQKHFLWWFGTPANETKLKNLKYAPNAVDMSGTEKVLFVVVIRDPYDWLRSFFLVPHDVHKDLLRKGFDHFIRNEWKLSPHYIPPDGNYSEIDNLNPWTGKRFLNVLDLRKYKILNYLSLSHLVNNYLIVRYEDVNEHPEEFINFVANYYHLDKSPQFFPINGYKGSRIPYQKKTYFPITKYLPYINSNIDWVTEKMVGYHMKTQVD